MKTVSLKIDDSIFAETERILEKLTKPRNRYINEAIAEYNRKQRRILIEQKLKQESSMVAENSQSVLYEFEAIDYVD